MFFVFFGLKSLDADLLDPLLYSKSILIEENWFRPFTNSNLLLLTRKQTTVYVPPMGPKFDKLYVNLDQKRRHSGLASLTFFHHDHRSSKIMSRGSQRDVVYIG